jgi:8-oxo-dGTP pyrophosphatase MutT (NUDIX family)
MGELDWFAFLQGGWEDDEDVYEAACREALEEAGVRGTINVTILYSPVSFLRRLHGIVYIDFVKAALANAASIMQL